VPELSRFYGIVIRIYADEHPPPHFHAQYGEHRAAYYIEGFGVMKGRLPRRAEQMVLEWAGLHESELKDAWKQIQRHQHPSKIEPLA